MIAVSYKNNFWTWDFPARECCVCVGDRMVSLYKSTMEMKKRPEGWDLLDIDIKRGI